MTAELCKIKLHFLKNHIKDQNDLFSNREILLYKIASTYPKYNQLIQTLPILIELVPKELKEKIIATENIKILKIGALLIKE
ncbi:unnamed protein product [Penicillium salamii]|nr:unnamed protein product [Penicillium salamii]